MQKVAHFLSFQTTIHVGHWTELKSDTHMQKKRTKYYKPQGAALLSPLRAFDNESESMKESWCKMRLVQLCQLNQVIAIDAKNPKMLSRSVFLATVTACPRHSTKDPTLCYARPVVD